MGTVYTENIADRPAAGALLCRAATGRDACRAGNTNEARRNEQHGRIDLTAARTATGKQATPPQSFDGENSLRLNWIFFFGCVCVGVGGSLASLWRAFLKPFCVSKWFLNEKREEENGRLLAYYYDHAQRLV